MRPLSNRARIVACFQSDGGMVCLVLYPDGSWGIVQDGKVVSAWRSDETAGCITAFVEMGGFDDSVPSMGVTESHEPITASGDIQFALLDDRLQIPPPRPENYRYN